MFLNADQLNIWTSLQTFKLWVRKECDYGFLKKERRKSIDLGIQMKNKLSTSFRQSAHCFFVISHQNLAMVGKIMTCSIILFNTIAVSGSFA